MLLDEFDPKHHMNVVLPESTRVVMQAKYKARRYQFDPEVIRAAAMLIKDHPNILLDNFQFALPTYENMYMEVDINEFQEALGAPTTSDILKISERDKIIGYIISDNTIRTILTTTENSNPVVAQIVHTMNDHTPVPGCRPVSGLLHKRMQTTETDELIKDELPHLQDSTLALAHLLGTTLSNPRANLTQQQADELQRRFQVWVPHGLPKRMFERAMVGSMGEIRTVLMFLLWLNQPKVVELSHQSATRRWRHARQISYAAHHVVKLKSNLNRKKIIRAFGGARPPRRHEVSAFWRNFEKTSGCIHDWPIFPDEREHYHCSKCSQWRTRVSQHERGDATLGFVTKEYKVCP